MEQKVVVNTTDQEVNALFDGQNIVFGPGQKKMFAIGVALEIVRERSALKLEEEVEEEPVAKEPVVAEEVGEPPVAATRHGKKKTAKV